MRDEWGDCCWWERAMSTSRFFFSIIFIHFFIILSCSTSRLEDIAGSSSSDVLELRYLPPINSWSIQQIPHVVRFLLIYWSVCDNDHNTISIYFWMSIYPSLEYKFVNGSWEVWSSIYVKGGCTWHPSQLVDNSELLAKMENHLKEAYGQEKNTYCIPPRLDIVTILSQEWVSWLVLMFVEFLCKGIPNSSREAITICYFWPMFQEVSMRISSRFCIQLVTSFHLGAEVAWESLCVVIDGSAADSVWRSSYMTTN